MTPEEFLKSDDATLEESAANFLSPVGKKAASALKDYRVREAAKPLGPFSTIGGNQPTAFNSGVPPITPPSENPDYAGLKSFAEDPNKVSDIATLAAGSAMLPFTAAGKYLSEGAEDAAAVLAGNPSGFGNLQADYGERTPFEKTVAETSKTHPVASTAAKIAAGTVENAPMMAVGLPEGVIGKLVSAGFTAQMINSGGKAATALGIEMGKNPEDRDQDVITSAISDLSQSGVFSGLAGAHALKNVVDATGAHGFTPEQIKASDKTPYVRPIQPTTGEPNASEIPSPKVIPQPEIRPPVGEEVSLRQQGETASSQTGDNPTRSEVRGQAPRQPITEQNVESLPADQLAKVRHSDGIAYGLGLTDADAPRLQAKYDETSNRMIAAATSGDDNAIQSEFGKLNFYGGALMGATRGRHPISGSNFTRFIKEHPELTPSEQTPPPPIDIEHAEAAPKTTVPSGVASVPVMITRKMESDLRNLGYSDEDIGALKPQEANDILQNKTASPTKATGGSSLITDNGKIEPKPEIPVNPKTEPETIAGTAIKLKNGMIFRGSKPNTIHAGVVDEYENSDLGQSLGQAQGAIEDAEGFVTSTGRFVNRAEATKIANAGIKSLGAEHLTATGKLSKANIKLQKQFDEQDEGKRAAAQLPKTEITPIVDTIPEKAQSTESEPSNEIGQPKPSTPELDVRPPAGTGATTPPTEQTGAVSGGQKPASAGNGGSVKTGSRTVRGRSVPGSPGSVTGPTGESGTGSRSSDNPAERTGGNNEQPRSESDVNHVLPKESDFIPSGDKAKVRANLDAIKLLKKLEAENRNPTPDEKAILAKYTGWGGLKEVFDTGKAAYRDRAPWNEDQKREYANWEKAWGKLYDEVKASLTDEEHDRAARSILNAHYTSRDIINAVWKAVERLGFKGGNSLEPAAGVGHFIGLTPEGLRSKTNWKAVELDSISGRIASKLYPQAKVHQMGFQDAKIPANSQDLVISNVPFDAEGPTDKRYPNFSLHNYFFARSLDLVKPGGIVAEITSDSTMDSAASRKAREYMAEKADLIGAIRLPNNAFKKNAGTEVTTDILFFRKRTGTPFKDAQDFVRTVPSETYKGEPITINEYFQKHPEMMLGRMSLEGTMYRADQQALIPTPGKELTAQLEEAISKLPENVFGAEQSGAERSSKVIQSDQGAKVGGLVIKDGVPYRVEGDGSMVKPDWAGNTAKVNQAKRYVTLRDATTKAIGEMLNPDAPDKEIEASREHLNRLYDEYVKKHGAINERSSSFLDDDVDFPLALALEDANTKTVETPKGPKRVTEWTKSKIFSERTLFPRNPPSKVDSVPDALQVSMNYAGKVDPAYMAKLTGRSEDSVKSELRQLGTAFENPETGQWETRAEYLSGFVKDKLRQAMRAAQDDPTMLKNVEELKSVQPPPVAIENIGYKLGSRWIPEKIIEQFIKEVLDVDADVSLTPQTGDWHVNARAGYFGERNKTVFGIHDWKGHELVEAALNLKSPKVTKIVPDGKGGSSEVKDPQKTLEAEAKQQELQQQFKKFVASHPEAASEMEAIYNDQHNGTVAPKFEPPTWAHYPGASADVTLREHQKAVVSRMLQNSTLLAHAVGTGKTYAMVTAAMEMRRLGLAKKPMIVVQNATLEQFARSFKRLYPTARLLVPNAKARDALNRNKTMSRIATGDWDAVIIPQSFVNMLPDDPIREEKWIRDQIDQLENDKIDAARMAGKRSPKAADLQRAIGRLEDRLESLKDRKKDNVLNFEDLGVDALFVDEAHAYKKLQFTTKMDSIKGLDTGASQRGLSMMFKARWVQEKNQGRNVIFATGTPVSNTIAEAWTMMRYLRPDVLKKYHIEDFDSFAGTFGDTITGLEMTATGNWKPVTRFAKYMNGPELIAAWRTVADVVTPEEINLPGLPALKNGKTTAVTIPQTTHLAGYIRYLQSELERFAKMSGKQKRENSHIPLVVFGRAKKASLDMRMIDPTLPDEATSKLNVAADNITRIYKDSDKNKGTQMVFSDSFQDNPESPKFNLYNALRDKLIERGVPADKIVIITPEIKDAKREALFQKVNRGDIRVVIGSTERMGVGVNAQERMIGLHHLDAPPRPMDIEQRNGRILRQGNSNPEVEIINYGVENTLDAAMYQKLATKQKFINQILRGDISGRNFEDAANEQSLTFEEQMAAFSGDKRAMEKVSLENQVRQLEMLRSGHFEQLRKARETITDLESRQIPYNKDQIAAADTKVTQYAEAFPPGYEVTLKSGNSTIKGKKEASEALDKILKDAIDSAERVAKAAGKFGDYIGSENQAFSINGKPVNLKVVLRADDKGVRDPDRSSVAWKFADGNTEHNAKSGAGFFMGLSSELEGINREPKWQRDSLASKERNLTELKGFVKQPFEREPELKQSAEKLVKLNAELEAEGKDKPATTTEPPSPEIVGMGGAIPAEFINDASTPTSIKNATVDQERAKRGLPPAMQPAKRSFGEVWDRAMAAIDQDPRVVDELLKELRFKPRALTDLEDALLLHRQIGLQNDYGKLTRDLAQAHDDAQEFPNRLADVEELKLRVAAVSDELFDLYNIGKKVGTETGRGLNARKMLAYEDFTLAQMELEKRAANGGRPLTDAERSEIQTLHDKIAETQKRYDDYVTATDARIADLEVKAALNRIQQTSKPTASPYVIKIAERIVSSLDKRADAARARIRERMGRTNAGVDPTILVDLAEIGASHIGHIGLDFAKWSDAMIKDLGEWVKPHLQTVFDTSQKVIDDTANKLSDKANSINVKRTIKREIPEKIKSTKAAIASKMVEGRKDELTSNVQKLARLLIEDGVTGRDDLIDAVHNALREIDPQITRRQAMDAISGYGDFKQLSKDEISVELRGLKGEMQQISKLEDMAAGVPPRKTGVERRTPTEEERRLIKAVNEAKIKFQVPITDPTTQLKSALDTRKIQLQRRTAELQAKISNGDFSTKPRRELWMDAEGMRLKAENERVKRDYKTALIRDRLKKRTTYEKTMDALVKWRRAFILSSPITLAKLTSAAAQRMVFTPVEEAIGKGISTAIPSLGDKARVEGGGSVTAEAKALTDGFVKGMADAKKVIMTGSSDLDVLYGKHYGFPMSAIDFIGNIHGALKTVPKRAAFARTFEKLTQADIRNGIDVSDPMVQSKNALAAYKEANKSIFLQDNRVVSAYKRALSAFDEKNKSTGHVPIGSKIAGTTARVLLPIVKIPTNIVAETMQYALGSVTGSTRLALAVRRGMDNLKPEEADLIMRELKKGSLGAALLLVGFFNPGMIGGYYQPGEKRGEKDVKAGAIKIDGHNIPSFLLHNPLLETLQIGATVRRVADSKMKKSDTTPQGIPSGVMAGSLGLTEEVPFVREMLEVTKAFNPKEKGAFWGELIKSITIPQLVQWLATQTDKRNGNTVPRHATNTVQHIETGIPGLRKNVPVSKK